MDKQELLQKAQQRDISAIEEVANNYYRGLNEFEEDNDQAFYWYGEAIKVDSKNVVGLNGLGNCYFNGSGTIKDQDKGIAYYRKAAELGYSNAQYNLAKRLEEENNKECFFWYTKAAEQDDGDALYRLFKMYRDGDYTDKDIDKAAWCLERAAQVKNIDAMIQLACLYETGEDGIVSKDNNKSLEWMLAAANEGSHAAMSNLAISYRTGDIVEPNIDTSIEWAKKAAEKGNGNQLFYTALEYKNGEGREQDKQKALELFKFGADCGHDRCMIELALNELGDAVNFNEVSPDRARAALEWAKKAATLGNETGFSLILRMGDTAYGEEKAKEVYFEAAKEGADNGYYHCMYEVFRCYNQGYGTERDGKAALNYLHRAADGEWPAALYELANIYKNKSEGSAQDKIKALQLYQRAAEQEYTNAYNGLGDCYNDGIGTEKNILEAVHWYQRSVEEGTGTMAASSAMSLGLIYLYYDKGSEIECDKIKALHYIERANDPSYPNPYVQIVLDSLYSDENITDLIDSERAKKFYSEKANEGDPHAMYEMGRFSEHNIILPGDEAINWYDKAANAGDVKAQWRLGFYYMVSDESVEAAKYFEMGAAQNHPGCLIHMANYLINGSNGVPRDDVKAFSYYSRAADLGSAEGWYKKGLCYQAGAGTNKNNIEAFNSFTRAQELGCKEMWFELGEYYRQGLGTPQNMPMALECYKHGADEENCHFCQRNLGLYYSGSLGDESVFNEKLARKYLVPLADGGNQEFAPVAQFALGLVAEKTGETQEMINRMEQAANNGVDNALMKLGFYYTLGDGGVTKNLGKAKVYFTAAANKGIPDASDMLSQIQQLELQQTSQPQRSQQVSSQPSQSSGGSSGGCYVATCVYGSYDCPEVWTLRRYRDYTLAQTWYGRLFIKAYYYVSPKAVRAFGKYDWFKHLWKGKLDRFVNKLQKEGFESTPYND